MNTNVENNDIHEYSEIRFLVKGLYLFEKDIKKIYDDFKSKYKDTSIVIVNSDLVYGIEHIYGVMKIINEEIKRNSRTNIKNFEIEILLRLCQTNQISNAFKINNNNEGKYVFILFSRDRKELMEHIKEFKTFGKEDSRLVSPSESKKSYIIHILLNRELKDSNQLFKNGDEKFQRFLIERSAIALK